jgi:RecA-family ATPase
VRFDGPEDPAIAAALGLELEPAGQDDGTALYQARRLADVQPERVEWLWAGRLPRGKVITLDGDPGVGKSTLALTLAAHVTTGRRWPDGQPCPVGGVVLLTAEDGVADTVRPRLDAAGGDPSRVHVLDSVAGGADQDGHPTFRPPTIADVPQLEALVTATGAVLVTVDVLMAHLPARSDSHRDQDMRAVLSPLARMAERRRCAVVLLRHLNKGTGKAIYRGGGSIGIGGAGRVGWLVGRDPDDDGLAVLAQTKNNLARMPAALTYRLVDAEGVGKVQWCGESARTADELSADPRADGDDKDERDALAGFLLDHLERNGGQASAKDATKAVSAAFGAVNKMALKRARDRAGIVTAKGGMHSGWVWSLPEGNAEGHEGHRSQNPGNFGTFALPSGAPAERELGPLGDLGDLPPQAGSACPGCGEHVSHPDLFDGWHVGCAP